MTRKAERQKEVHAVREHARNSARQGVPFHKCPYRDCDEIQWKEAYRRELEEMQLEATQSMVGELEDLIESAESIDDLKTCMLRLLSQIEELRK